MDIERNKEALLTGGNSNLFLIILWHREGGKRFFAVFISIAARVRS